MDDISRRHGRSLPHWSRPDRTYFLTFRTADATPADIVRSLREEYEAERRQLARELGRPPSHDECLAIRTQRYRRAEKYLERDQGACLLRGPRAARIAADAIRFFDGERYRLHAWCLMPNHAHVMLTICGERLPTEVVGA